MYGIFLDRIIELMILERKTIGEERYGIKGPIRICILTDNSDPCEDILQHLCKIFGEYTIDKWDRYQFKDCNISFRETRDIDNLGIHCNLFIYYGNNLSKKMLGTIFTTTLLEHGLFFNISPMGL